MIELKSFGRSCWCRGGGVAVLFFLIVVNVFRSPRDLLFWAAIVVSVAYAAMVVWWYLQDRRKRATAIILRQHRSDNLPDPRLPNPLPAVMIPKIAVSSLVQQTKNTL